MLIFYHYEDGVSDKIWGIETNPESLGKHKVWFGRRACKLTCRISNVPDVFKKNA